MKLTILRKSQIEIVRNQSGIIIFLVVSIYWLGLPSESILCKSICISFAVPIQDFFSDQGFDLTQFHRLDENGIKEFYCKDHELCKKKKTRTCTRVTTMSASRCRIEEKIRM